jgi:hypothetical protein
MKTVLAFWAATIVFLSGLLLWRNKRKYPSKRVYWLITKSLTELTIVVTSAIRMPALLCAWISLWVTKPIKEPWLRTTVGVLLAVGLGWLALFGMEVILLLSVLAVDDITGEQSGFLGNLKRAKEAEKERNANNAKQTNASNRPVGAVA